MGRRMEKDCEYYRPKFVVNAKYINKDARNEATCYAR